MEEQLTSYLAQSLQPIHVLASDDSADQRTQAHFTRFLRHHRTEDRQFTGWQCRQGPQAGLTANFIHLLSEVRLENTDYVALSDQDDIWLPEKLETAVAMLSPYGDRPTILGTRSWEWNDRTDQRQISRNIPKPHCFQHALVQNYAGGNTMVLNRAAMALVQSALTDMPLPAIHDWWLYQLITGAGGVALLDPEPRLLYRQHGNNQVGANASLRSKVLRFSQMLTGTYKIWMSQNLAALTATQHLLTPEARNLLKELDTKRNGPLPDRIDLMLNYGLHRKGRINQAALWIAALLKKI